MTSSLHLMDLLSRFAPKHLTKHLTCNIVASFPRTVVGVQFSDRSPVTCSVPQPTPAQLVLARLPRLLAPQWLRS